MHATRTSTRRARVRTGSRVALASARLCAKCVLFSRRTGVARRSNNVTLLQNVLRELEHKKPQLDDLVHTAENLKADSNRQQLHSKGKAACPPLYAAVQCTRADCDSRVAPEWSRLRPGALPRGLPRGLAPRGCSPCMRRLFVEAGAKFHQLPAGGAGCAGCPALPNDLSGGSDSAVPDQVPDRPATATGLCSLSATPGGPRTPRRPAAHTGSPAGQRPRPAPRSRVACLCQTPSR